MVQPLSAAINNLDAYYTAASLPGNYSPITNKFTDKFLDIKKHANIPVEQINEVIWYQAAEIIITKALADINMALSTVIPSNKVDYTELNKLIFPIEAATLHGTKAFIDMAKNIETQLTNIINSVGQSNLFKMSKYEGDPNTNVAPTPGSSNVRRNFIVKSFFDGFFDAGEDPHVGYSYMDTSAGAGYFINAGIYGIPYILKDNYLKRVTGEAYKFFTTLDINIPMGLVPGPLPGSMVAASDTLEISKYTYLTPTQVAMPQWAPKYKVIRSPTNTEGPPDKYNSEILRSILTYNVGRNKHGGAYPADNLAEWMKPLSPKWLKPDKDLRQFKLFELLKDKSCTFSIWGAKKQSSAEKDPSAAYKAGAWRDLKGIDSLIVPYAVKELDLLGDQMKLTSYDSGNPDSLVRNTVYNFPPGDALFPNQLKSLTVPPESIQTWTKMDWFDKKELPPPNPITGKSGQIYNTGLTWDNMATFILNYMTIAQVKVFSGFKIDTQLLPGLEKSPTHGRPMMKNPIWEPLDGEEWGKPSEGKALFCKLVPYNAKFFVDDISFEYRPIKSLQLPIYNEHFIIEF